jgi:hypothetical protein
MANSFPFYSTKFCGLGQEIVTIQLMEFLSTTENTKFTEIDFLTTKEKKYTKKNFVTIQLPLNNHREHRVHRDNFFEYEIDENFIFNSFVYLRI